MSSTRRRARKRSPNLATPSARRSAARPRSGSRSNDVELSILYGRKPDILSPNDYYEMRAAYRYRTNGLNDQWRTDASLGLEVVPNFYVIPAFRTIIAIRQVVDVTNAQPCLPGEE